MVLASALLLGRLLTLLKNIRLVWTDMPGEKHSSLLIKFINYSKNIFTSLGSGRVKCGIDMSSTLG
jgi:hypothetical protein